MTIVSDKEKAINIIKSLPNHVTLHQIAHLIKMEQ
jgi:hypothetical protein